MGSIQSKTAMSSFTVALAQKKVDSDRYLLIKIQIFLD
jgi:hypothetical protein